MAFALRYYQEEAKQAAEAILHAGGRCAVVLPTGCGKSALFASISRDWPADRGRVLILAHTTELIDQNANEVAGFIGERPDIEQAERRAYEWGGSKVVVASVSTLFKEHRLQSNVFRDRGQFGLVIVDECHHAVKNNQKYKNIINHFCFPTATEGDDAPPAALLGVTATADRTDKQGLTYFQQLAYEFPLAQAVNEGWLVPIRQQYGVCTSIDFSKVRVKCGEFVDADMERVMTEEKALHEVCGAIIEKCGDGRTLVFASGIYHAERLAEILTRHNVRATAVHGGNQDYRCSKDERKRRIEEFSLGVHQVLVGCDVFYEGFNVPNISHVVIAKKTRSRLRFAQAVGRGTRVLRSVKLPTEREAVAERKTLIAASDKPFMTVIDLVGASTQLELDLPCVADLLLPNASAEVRRRAKQNAMDKGQSHDPEADLQEAADQLAKEQKAREEAERERRARVTATTTYEWSNTGGIGTGERRHCGPVASRNVGGRGRPATEKQINKLKKFGIDATGMTVGEAGRELDRCFRNKNEARPTDGQLGMLNKHRLVAANREHASALIGLTIARRFRPMQLPTVRELWGMSDLPDGKWIAQMIDGHELRNIGEPHRTQDECRSYIKRLIAAEQQLQGQPHAAVA